MDPGGAEVAPASDAAARGLHRAGQHAHRAAPPPPSRLHVHADAEVRVLHYDELRVEAAQAPKVGRPAELRLVAKEQPQASRKADGPEQHRGIPCLRSVVQCGKPQDAVRLLDQGEEAAQHDLLLAQCGPCLRHQVERRQRVRMQKAQNIALRQRRPLVHLAPAPLHGPHHLGALPGSQLCGAVLAAAVYHDDLQRQRVQQLQKPQRLRDVLAFVQDGNDDGDGGTACGLSACSSRP
mmetsp:Transcript_7473/g.19177  ORF Transcript_7473/g.19177 Transcript_7473/m.19177 type:complete len:237 (-) Transcript_7473:103-813(-)